MKILITGGLGYIGAHICVALLQSGFEIGIIDNLSNSKKIVIQKVRQLTSKIPEYFEGDIRDYNFCLNVFTHFQPKVLIHLAGLKSVGDSFIEPIEYYDNNVAGTLTLIKCMQYINSKIIIFSSTANIYGDTNLSPVFEWMPAEPINPYGRSKYMVEQILRDLTCADPTWRVICLRYFNPVGAHSSGLIGEKFGAANSLMPIITQTAHGKKEKLSIFGYDYPTRDGTAIRDFIHVMDLAESHLAALNYLTTLDNIAERFLLLNVGTGQGISVLEMVLAFERTTGIKIPYELLPRRNGDIGISYASVALAEQIIGWKARFCLEHMCEDAWRWQMTQQNSV